MGDDQDGHFFLEFRHQFLDAGRGDRVERRGRLVEEDDLGIGCQGAGDAQALLLAAGKVGAEFLEPVADLVPQRGALERGLDAVVEFVLVVHAAHAQAVGDVLVDRLGEGIGLLEHHADAHAHFDRIDVGREQIGVVRVKYDAAAVVPVAGIQVVHAIEAAQQRRLAATRGPDQRRHMAVVDRHRHALQGVECAVVKIEVAHLGLEHGAFDTCLHDAGNLHIGHHLMFLRS